MMPLQSAISGKNLSIGYGNRQKKHLIQQSLNFDLFEGELVCLIGHNGSGKSTLIKTLAGFIPPIDGIVTLQNENIHQISISDRSKKISIVLTHKIEVENLTVTELVELGRNPYTNLLGALSDYDRAIVNQSIESVKLTNKQHEQLAHLSDGERQRAMIAKALCQQTPIILLDEPTAHLDLPNRIEILILLRELAHSLKKSILLSTHELDLALQISDRIMVMDSKNGLTVGIPEELIIDQVIQSIFDHTKFRFDAYTGVFRMSHPTQKEITLISKGEGYLTFWTERALNRIGMQIGDDAEIRITIDERRKCWIYDAPGFSTQFDRIEYLLEMLKK